MRPAAARPVIIVAMLGVTVALAAVLTAQAVSVARNHRVTAERVLQDYAALGAEGVVQRLKSALNGRFSTILLAIAAQSHDAAPASAATVRSALSGNARDVLDESSVIFRVGRQDSLAATIHAATAALPAYAYFGLRWFPAAHGGMSLLVFQPARDTSTQLAAFTLSETAASALITKLVANDPILPPSITHGALVDRGVGLRVTSARRELANRHFSPGSPFRATVPLEEPYGDLAVEVSLAESIAPSLIIGGLPRSRVPLLVALLLVTVALTVAAGDQLRRDLELSRLREDFVSSVSHELRTPLAQIRMFTETLRLRRVRTTEEHDRSLAIIENEVRRLEHLVENLLHFSRAERGALEVHRAATNLTSLIQDIVAEAVPLAAHNGSNIVLELAPDVHADVDPTAVRQIVLNLLDNAGKYGPRGQTIAVRLSTTAAVARLEVEDQGVGIEVSDRPHIWKRFWRSDSARRAGVAGAGVGLAIVSDAVRLHGGTATVESSAQGGARIVVCLPTSARNR